MFKLPAPSMTYRAVLSTFAAMMLLGAAGTVSAAPFKNLPTDQDAQLSVGVNVLYSNSAYDLGDEEVRVLPGCFMTIIESMRAALKLVLI